MSSQRVTISIGPGHYGPRLVEALHQLGVLHRAIYSWPEFVVERCDPGTGQLVPYACSPLYGLGLRAAFGLWRRVPLLGNAARLRTPQLLACDLLARRHVAGADLFIGWAQLSRRSLERARRLGAATVLEHPMCHVDLWNRLVDEEYEARLGRRAASLGYARFPAALVEQAAHEYEAAGHITVLSSYARESFVRAGMAPERLLCVPPGVDAHRFRPPASRRHRGVRALYVGRLELLKGVQYLLSALQHVGCEELELWLIGPVLPEMERLLHAHSHLRVRILGEVAADELPAYYQQVDFFVFPTLTDGFGLVLLEAMASGLPVIATDKSGGPDLIVEGENGFIVPSRDSEALARCMEILATEPERREAMGRCARQTVLRGYTWRHYRERVAAAYASLVPPRSAPSGSAATGVARTERSPQVGLLPLMGRPTDGGASCATAGTSDGSSASP